MLQGLVFFFFRFLCDLRQFSSFIPTCCQLVSADKTLSALAVRPFTLFLILNLTHPSHSNISWLPFLKISSLLQPSFFPSILLSFLCPSLTSPFSATPTLWLSCHNPFPLLTGLDPNPLPLSQLLQLLSVHWRGSNKSSRASHSWRRSAGQPKQTAVLNPDGPGIFVWELIVFKKPRMKSI